MIFFHVPGHLSNKCPEVPAEKPCNRGSYGRGSGGRTDTVMFHICVVLAQHYDEIIPSNWLFLDICYTSSVGMNPDIFKNIRSFC